LLTAIYFCNAALGKNALGDIFGCIIVDTMVGRFFPKAR
jgi:hypothetical protein